MDAVTGPRWRLAGALTAAAAAATLTRAWQLDRKNLWLDEAVSWETAIKPLPALIDQAIGDIHPPGYYLLLHAWTAVCGDSVSALRALSVVLGLIALWLSWRLCDRVISRAAAVTVLFWLAVSPHQVAYAQEARMYAAVTVAVLAALLAYRRWRESGETDSTALALFTAAMTCALYLHYFTALIVPALWLHLLLQSPASRLATVWSRWLGAHVIITLLYLPWLPTAIRQITQGQSWRQPVSLLDLPRYAGGFFRETLLGPHYGMPAMLLIAAIVIFLICGIGWLRLLVRASSRTRESTDVLLAIAVLVPLVTALLLMPISGEMQLSRYLAYLSPLLIVGAARGWSGGPRATRPAAIVAVLAAAAASTPWLAAHLSDSVKDTDLRPIAAEIRRAAAGGPAPVAMVAVLPGYMATPLTHHLRDVRLSWIRPTDDALTSVMQDRGAGTGGAPQLLVIERRSQTFGAAAAGLDASWVEIPVSGNTPEHARLYRRVR